LAQLPQFDREYGIKWGKEAGMLCLVGQIHAKMGFWWGQKENSLHYIS
ncbi:MAG: hypothetical protein ACD_17C00101G0001, partial [uncultured bacterium]